MSERARVVGCEWDSACEWENLFWTVINLNCGGVMESESECEADLAKGDADVASPSLQLIWESNVKVITTERQRERGRASEPQWESEHIFPRRWLVSCFVSTSFAHKQDLLHFQLVRRGRAHAHWRRALPLSLSRVRRVLALSSRRPRATTTVSQQQTVTANDHVRKALRDAPNNYVKRIT